MEYLRTPDVSNHPAWGHASPTTKPSPDPKQQAHQFPSTSTNNLPLPDSSTLSLSNAIPISAQQLPDATPGAQFTPRFSGSTPFFSNIAQHPSLDRAGIKNSFQTLFSPNPHASTPALLRSSQPPTGLTPFINGVTTPNLMPPPGTISPSPAPKHAISPVPGANPNDALLSSPYLQAAAKEAVRREFMNMPTYVSTSPSERTVPAMRYLSPSPQQQSSPMNTSSALPVVPSSMPPNISVSLNVPPTTPPKFVSPNSGDAKVPGTDMNSKDGESNDKPTTTATTPTTASSGDGGVDGKQASMNSLPMVSQSVPTVSQQQAHSMPQMSAPQPQMPPFFVPPGHPAPGMMMIGQHGPMMIGPPPGAMYAPPPGMMMFPGGQMFPQPGMMMPTAGRVPTDVPTKPESSEDRKARIEHEKQELIREFKKKTREAALVRFRQKRRERRFDKLIRYDCRKKLADARPRVKGRFVRVKNGEGDDDEISEGAQIVPDMEDT